jgi:hypothetical protein
MGSRSVIAKYIVVEQSETIQQTIYQKDPVRAYTGAPAAGGISDGGEQTTCIGSEGERSKRGDPDS